MRASRVNRGRVLWSPLGDSRPTPAPLQSVPARRSRKRFPAQDAVAEALEREPSQSAAKRLLQPRLGEGWAIPTNAAPRPFWRVLGPVVRPTDRRGVHEPGKRRNCTHAARAKLSRLAPSLPLRHSPLLLLEMGIFRSSFNEERGVAVGWASRRLVHAFKARGKGFSPSSCCRSYTDLVGVAHGVCELVPGGVRGGPGGGGPPIAAWPQRWAGAARPRFIHRTYLD